MLVVELYLTPRGKSVIPHIIECVSHVTEEPPLWSSGQSSWLQMQRSGFDSRRYQIF
jgi:hypothetical protein